MSFSVFEPSLIPDHDSLEYKAWSSSINSDNVKALQYTGRAWDTYTEDLRWALTMNGSGSGSHIASLSDQEVYDEVANQVWLGKLIVIRDLLDQSPQKWLLSPDNIALGHLDENRRDASWKRRAEGQNDFAQQNNLATDPPASKPVPPPVVDQQNWIHIDVLDDETGQPIRGVKMDIIVPEGSKGRSGTYQTNTKGEIEIMSLKPGTCTIESPTGEMTFKNTLSYVGSGTPSGFANSQGARPIGGNFTIADVEEYKANAGDTLPGIAANKGVDEKAIIQFNWQTTTQQDTNQRLIDDVGGIPPETEGGEVSFANDAIPGVILIPKPWQAPSVNTMTTTTMCVKVVTPPVVANFCFTYTDRDCTPVGDAPYHIISDGQVIDTGTLTKEGTGKAINAPVGATVDLYPGVDEKAVENELKDLRTQLSQAFVKVVEEARDLLIDALNKSPPPKTKVEQLREDLVLTINAERERLRQLKEAHKALSFFPELWEEGKSAALGVVDGVTGYVPNLDVLEEIVGKMDIDLLIVADAIAFGHVDQLEVEFENWKKDHKEGFEDATETMEIIILLMSDPKTREILAGVPQQFLEVTPDDVIIRLATSLGTGAAIDTGAVIGATTAGAFAGGIGAPIAGGSVLTLTMFRKGGKAFEATTKILAKIVEGTKKLRNKRKDAKLEHNKTSLKQDKNKKAKISVKIKEGATANLPLPSSNDEKTESLKLHADGTPSGGKYSWEIKNKEYFDADSLSGDTIELKGKAKGTADIVVTYSNNGEKAKDKISVNVDHFTKCKWKICIGNHEKVIQYPGKGLLTRDTEVDKKWTAAKIEPWDLDGDGVDSKATLAEYKEEDDRFLTKVKELKYPEYHTHKHHLISLNLFKKYPNITHNALLLGYNANHKRNGICLPTYTIDIIQHDLQYHRGRHKNVLYNDKISILLDALEIDCADFCKKDIKGDITTQLELIDELNHISDQIVKKIKGWKWLLNSQEKAAREKSRERYKNLK